MCTQQSWERQRGHGRQQGHGIPGVWASKVDLAGWGGAGWGLSAREKNEAEWGLEQCSKAAIREENGEWIYS